MTPLIRALVKQLERIADTYEKDLCWRQRETSVSAESKAALTAVVARGAAVVRKLNALATSFKVLDESTTPKQ